MVTLGSVCKDMVTGLEGVAVARTEWLHGCTRISLEQMKPGKDGEVQESQSFDEQRVEVLEKDRFPSTPPEPCAIALGSKVKDTVTGFSGMAVCKTVWLHGTQSIGIEPTTLHEGKPIQAHDFNVKRVVLIEEGKPPMSPHADPTRPGGPQKDPSYSKVR